jgi:hypothetical protein
VGQRRLREHVAGIAVVGALAATACTAPHAPDAAGQNETSTDTRFEGQLVAILPFDTKNPSCADDPTTMPAATLAACSGLDPAQLPAKIDVTFDIDQFDVRSDHAMLILRGPTLDTTQTDFWVGIVGMGPAPSNTAGGGSGGLVGQSVRPQFIPLLVGGAVLVGETAAGAAIADATVALLGVLAVAIVGHEILQRNRAQPVVQGTQQALTNQQQIVRQCETQPLADNCDKDECKRRLLLQKNLCDEGGSCNSLTDCAAIERTMRVQRNCINSRRDVQLCFDPPDFDGHQTQIDQLCTVFRNCGTKGQDCLSQNQMAVIPTPSPCGI